MDPSYRGPDGSLGGEGGMSRQVVAPPSPAGNRRFTVRP